MSTTASTTPERMVIAIDPHKASWTAAAVDASLQPVATIRVPVSRDGYRALRRFATRWPDPTWAIEGASGLGAPLSARLRTDGIDVVDVPAKLAARVLMLSTGHGRKNDDADAVSVAIAALTAAVARITWCVDQHAIGVITGEVGAGKTVAIRAATAGLDPARHVIIYLSNPSVGVRGMLHHVVGALGRVPSFYTATLAPQAAEALAAEHAERGRTPVVVIDEAHLLDNAQMEAIRMLTNHDMDSGSPFAALLVGQPTLRHRLRVGVLAALDQRIAVRYAIAGMQPADTADYIAHHAKIAGRTDRLFSDDAITLIHNAARGYPRAVNNLAVHALTAAFAAKSSIVDEKSARIAVTETGHD